MITRSANGASRSPAIHSASGSRSIPMTFKPANSVRNRSACPPAPRVASTRTGPDPSALCRVTAGRSSSTQRSSRTGMWPLITTPAPWSLSDCANLALGKYARVGSGRGHDARACASEDVAQGLMGGRGEVVFVSLLVLLPGLRVPDLQVVNRSRHDAVLGQIGVAAMFGRQGDPALGVGVLLVGPRRQ